jgi:hypothetical protein
MDWVREARQEEARKQRKEAETKRRERQAKKIRELSDDQLATQLTNLQQRFSTVQDCENTVRETKEKIEAWKQNYLKQHNLNSILRTIHELEKIVGQELAELRAKAVLDITSLWETPVLYAPSQDRLCRLIDDAARIRADSEKVPYELVQTLSTAKETIWEMALVDADKMTLELLLADKERREKKSRQKDEKRQLKKIEMARSEARQHGKNYDLVKDSQVPVK